MENHPHVGAGGKRKGSPNMAGDQQPRPTKRAPQDGDVNLMQDLKERKAENSKLREQCLERRIKALESNLHAKELERAEAYAFVDGLRIRNRETDELVKALRKELMSGEVDLERKESTINSLRRQLKTTEKNAQSDEKKSQERVSKLENELAEKTKDAGRLRDEVASKNKELGTARKDLNILTSAREQEKKSSEKKFREMEEKLEAAQKGTENFQQQVKGIELLMKQQDDQVEQQLKSAQEGLELIKSTQEKLELIKSSQEKFKLAIKESSEANTKCLGDGENPGEPTEKSLGGQLLTAACDLEDGREARSELQKKYLELEKKHQRLMAKSAQDANAHSKLKEAKKTLQEALDKKTSEFDQANRSANELRGQVTHHIHMRKMQEAQTQSLGHKTQGMEGQCHCAALSRVWVPPSTRAMASAPAACPQQQQLQH